MAVYQPTWTDKETGELKTSKVWWYRFRFAGREIRESSKSTRKTVARDAEKNRRAELERGYNGIEDKRDDRMRTINEMCDVFLADYRLRNPRSVTYAEHAIGKLKELIGASFAFDVTETAVRQYQAARLTAGAAPKTINEETGFLLRILGDQGDVIRLRLRRQKALRLRTRSQVSKAFTEEEKEKLIQAAKLRRSPHIYPALVLALNTGMRDSEIRKLQWGRVNLKDAIVTVGDSKTEAGAGRTIPLNDEALRALVDHARWYLEKFHETRPEWYVFPFGKPQPTVPTKPLSTLKTAWKQVKADAGVTGRWHDNRHTFITDLAQSPEASDETIMDMAGHVSKQMLKHYSHIRMEAKRRAVQSLNKKPAEPQSGAVSDGVVQESAQVSVLM